MPKVIKNIDKKILLTAKKLFQDKGFDSIDMRFIAKEVGIAVGTLYNYHSNKTKLFAEVVEYSWQETTNECEMIKKKNIREDKKLIEVLIKVFEDCNARNGIGMQYMVALQNKGDFKEINEKVKGFWKNCASIAKEIIEDGIYNDIFKVNREFLDILIFDLIMLAIHLRKVNTKEDGKKYITYRVESMLK